MPTRATALLERSTSVADVEGSAPDVVLPTAVRSPWPDPLAVHRTSASLVLLPLRLFLAAGWLRAGAEKLIDPAWWSGAELRSFLDEQQGSALPFFRPVMEDAIAPNAMLVALVVMVTQLICGVLIATGHHLGLALRWAIVMNVAFVLAGRVDPSAFYLAMEVALLFAIAAGVIGVAATTPSRRSLVVAGGGLVAALAVAPFIRTVHPAEVIHDPAMMIAFLSSLVALGSILRYVAAGGVIPAPISRLWSERGVAWISARPPVAR